MSYLRNTENLKDEQERRNNRQHTYRQIMHYLVNHQKHVTIAHSYKLHYEAFAARNDPTIPKSLTLRIKNPKTIRTIVPQCLAERLPKFATNNNGYFRYTRLT